VYFPLLSNADPESAILFSEGRVRTRGELVGRATALAAALPAGVPVVNLCEQRAHFLVVYCAALLRGSTTLLPQSRAPEVVAELTASYPGAVVCDDEWAERSAHLGPRASAAEGQVQLPGEHIAHIAFTSGSTGQPRGHPKRWASLRASSACNAARLRECLGSWSGATPWILATVPAQHMYGCETSVLLPLLESMAVHAARPLFPADIAARLAELPEPRVLVTTPVHLRVLAEVSQALPPLAAIVSATAPLDPTLAGVIEQASGGAPLLEMFGATETCVIATRRTTREAAWHLYPGVRLESAELGTLVHAPWFDSATLLSDHLEPMGPERFVLRGRSRDMIEVAGKRASLAELTRRLLEIDGVADAVVFQPEESGASGAVRRVAALVVAPGQSAPAIVRQLTRSVDPAFLPRPLLLVEQLPRNAVGKLILGDLNAALRAAAEGAG
jgi:acyl-coenzyme A synthetase/AMP-(fatty) acid ligase